MTDSDQAPAATGADSPRPAWHLTPERNWMNDPNGLVHVDGVFHAFFQYNPGGAGWGNMSWGHAVSEDLLTWRELDVAIPFTDTEQVYSGSAVIDHGNTSGLGDGETDPVVAIYTAATTDGLQAQALAFSRDRGMTWERYAGNPVLDRGSREFRDPKVFRYSDGDGPARWIMVAVEAVAHEVLIYSSENLRDWTWESKFDVPMPLDELWECPDLISLPLDGEERWVMLLSTHSHDPANTQGSRMRWFLGDFDGHRFVPAPGEQWRLLDLGRDFYAGVTFSDAPDGRRLMLGWMSNWQYAREVPTEPFRGAMSLPRELSLRAADARAGSGGIDLVQRPVVPEGVEWRPVDVAAHEPAEIEVGVTGVLSVEADLAGGRALVLELCSGDDVLATVTLDGPSRALTFDRPAPGGDGVHETFPSVRRMPLGGDGRLASVQIYLDAHLVEIFASDGAAVMSHQAFVGADGWRLRVAGDASAQVMVGETDTE